MEEENLLKERLQAITDKRRIQEDIAKKRRQIEEEKLKLQYIKKKALREQWLMDGLSQQTEEEQEAMRQQVEEEQQQSHRLQSDIRRIEKEIESLETQELSISANEEAVLKRLKEVERTPEDIIKELNADLHQDVMCSVPSPLPDILDIPYFIQPTHSCQSVSQEPKTATFAVEISVEHDKRTGKSQVISTATVTPAAVQEKGFKVYEDSRKSVYALPLDGRQMPGGPVGEMTLTEVEELLRQATEAPSEVQYHQPVYSTPYTGTSRPSTPRTPTKTPSPSGSRSTTSPKRQQEENQSKHDRQNTRSPKLNPRMEPSDIPGQSKTENLLLRPHTGGRSISNRKSDVSPKAAALVSVTAKSEGMPVPVMPVYRSVESAGALSANRPSEVDPQESLTSLDLVNNFPEELQSGPVTMIFMGYEKADDEEEEDIQAELVVIGNSDDDNDECQKDVSVQEHVSYHPEGYRSKVFQPKVGVAKVTGRRDVTDDAYTHWDDLVPHKPTFIHRPGRGRGLDESANTGSINMEKMKLCSTRR